MATAAQVAQEVKRQGGSDQQAWVAAALVSGIESNGQPTDKNPTSTACGLFQFLTTTWISNGGGKYAPNACAASWQQQVSVYLTASQGNNFYPWAPDLGGAYNGKPIYGPTPGSKVANKISQLASSGQLSFLGNVPANWADAGGATGLSSPTQGQLPFSGSDPANPSGGSGSPSGSCDPTIYLVNASPFHFINQCQAQQILGALYIGIGALALILGFGIVLADIGLRKSVPAVVGAVIGDRAGKASATKRAAAATPPDDEDTAAIRNARRTYDRQQRTEYNRQMNSGLHKRKPIGKTQPDRDF